MAKLTITEALQEIKTIGKRLEKKRAAVQSYLVRDARVRDPLEKDGGSAKFVEQERQSIADLEKRIIAIRTAIQDSNSTKTLVLGGVENTVAEWLTWRREVAPLQQRFANQLLSAINVARVEAQRKGGKVTAAAVAVNEAYDPTLPETVVNIDEKALVAEIEQIEQVLGELDGKLSLFNATALVEV